MKIVPFVMFFFCDICHEFEQMLFTAASSISPLLPLR